MFHAVQHTPHEGPVDPVSLVAFGQLIDVIIAPVYEVGECTYRWVFSQIASLVLNAPICNGLQFKT